MADEFYDAVDWEEKVKIKEKMIDEIAELNEKLDTERRRNYDEKESMQREAALKWRTRKT